MPKKTAAKKPPPDEGRAVPLVWVGLEDVPAQVATNVMVQGHEDLFILTFGFTNLPAITGTKASRQKQLDAVGVITVTPISKVALTEAQLEKTIKTLQTNLRRYRKQKYNG